MTEFSDEEDTKMDNRQKALARMAQEIANEWIGGLENQMCDSLPGEEDFEEAKEQLEQGHDWWVNAILSEVKVDREAQKHLKFAGNKFLEEHIDKMLKKMGY